MTFEKGLDTTNYGDRSALRDHGQWLAGTYVKTVNASRYDLITSLKDVVDWTGEAAQNFKLDMQKWVNEQGKLVAAAQAIDRAEDALADGLAKVAEMLASAEAIAREAGLAVKSGENAEGKVESYILPPDQPTSPAAVLNKYKQKPEEWVQAHKTQLEDEYYAAAAAEKDYGRKINAFHHAKAKIAQARKVERDAHADFRKALGEAIAPVLDFYSLAKMGGGVTLNTVSAGMDVSEHMTKRADALRLLAQEMYGTADLQEKVYIGKHLTDADKAKVAAWIQYRTAAQNAPGEWSRRVQSIDKWLDQIPPKVRRAIELNPAHYLEHLAYAEKPGRHRGVGRYENLAKLILKNEGATKILRGVPLVGTAFTVGTGVGEVVILGEDPTKVVVKTVAGELATIAGGAAAGAVATALLAPGGVVVGAVVITGWAAGQGAEALVEAVWLDDLDDFDLHVYRDDETDRDYTRRN